MPTVPYTVSGTGQVVTGGGTLDFVTLRGTEDVGTLVLHDSNAASGKQLANMCVASGGYVVATYPKGIRFSSGIYGSISTSSVVAIVGVR